MTVGNYLHPKTQSPRLSHLSMGKWTDTNSGQAELEESRYVFDHHGGRKRGAAKAPHGGSLLQHEMSE